MNNPIHMLKHEHLVIMKVVDAMDLLRQRMASGEVMNVALFREIIKFMRKFADQCHHAKEEDLLFPAMVALGVPESGCPIGGLKHEHIQGRELVTQLEKAIDLHAIEPVQARQIAGDTIHQMVNLYTNHIWKEDDMVFPMAEKLFNAGQLAHLEEAFEQAEETLGSEHHLFETFADSLKHRLAV